MQAASPLDLRILAAIEGGTALERDLHEHFAAERLHGEWFNNSANLVSYIGRILGASKEYRDHAEDVELIRAMAAEEDDGAYLAVELETARYLRYARAQERLRQVNNQILSQFIDLWRANAPTLGWRPSDDILRKFLTKYPPEVVHEALEVTAPKCQGGWVRRMAMIATLGGHAKYH